MSSIESPAAWLPLPAHAAPLTRDLWSGSGGGGADPSDIFSMFFGGGRRQRSGPRKGEDVVHQMNVTLEELYNGKTRKLAINRKVPANADEDPGPCPSCNGQGVKMVTRQIGPGMIQQMQVQCPNCGGVGFDCEVPPPARVPP